MGDKRTGILLTAGAFVVLAVGLAIVIWVVQPHVFPECRPNELNCDPTGHPPTDERIPLRLSILGVTTAIAIVLVVIGRWLRDRAT